MMCSIFTGDVVEGAVWLVTGKSFTDYTYSFLTSFPDTEVTNDLNDAYSRMKSLGQAYAVVGNHDVSPVNSFPPGAVDTTISSQWAYDTMSSDWSSWIGATAASQADSNFGSYSVLTSEGNNPVLPLYPFSKNTNSTVGLRIISVNTNFWYKVSHSYLFARPASNIENSKTSGFTSKPWRETLQDNWPGL
jgi:sphingomyelin phosphodiesterase